MKRYMILVEILNSGCTASFFDDFNAAMDFAETLQHEDYFVEVYMRSETIFEDRVIGFEYRRIG